MGVWPKKLNVEVTFDPGENIVKRVGKRDGKLWYIDVGNLNNEKLIVKEKMASKQVWSASIDSVKEMGHRCCCISTEFLGYLQEI